MHFFSNRMKSFSYLTSIFILTSLISHFELTTRVKRVETHKHVASVAARILRKFRKSRENLSNFKYFLKNPFNSNSIGNAPGCLVVFITKFPTVIDPWLQPFLLMKILQTTKNVQIFVFKAPSPFYPSILKSQLHR